MLVYAFLSALWQIINRKKEVNEKGASEKKNYFKDKVNLLEKQKIKNITFLIPKITIR